MVYHSYPGEGYEEGPAKIGLAHTNDPTLTRWTRFEQPILSWEDGAEWERGGLYKSCLLQHEGTFYLFYNAKNAASPWVEQIGLATSTDLLHWTRYAGNPILRVTPNAWDSRFASDPYVVQDGDTWVMYYYGFDGGHAQNGIAFSRDLLHWDKHPEPILRYGKQGLDTKHAHKPAVIDVQGTLYHYYCAVRPSQPSDTAFMNYGNSAATSEFRCIAVATGED